MLSYAVAMFLVLLGVYALMTKENLIKKIIGLGIMSNGIHLFAISLGYKLGGIAPILQDLNMVYFITHSVDPLPQALILTSIVINLSITSVALSLIIRMYRKVGSMETDDIRRLKG